MYCPEVWNPLQHQLLTVVKAIKSTVNPAILPVDLSQLATAQQDDSEIQELSKKADSQISCDPTRVHCSRERIVVL